MGQAIPFEVQRIHKGGKIVDMLEEQIEEFRVYVDGQQIERHCPGRRQMASPARVPDTSPSRIGTERVKRAGSVMCKLTRVDVLCEIDGRGDGWDSRCSGGGVGNIEALAGDISLVLPKNRPQPFILGSEIVYLRMD